jgi:phage terminase large subunit-like protein
VIKGEQWATLKWLDMAARALPQAPGEVNVQADLSVARREYDDQFRYITDALARYAAGQGPTEDPGEVGPGSARYNWRLWARPNQIEPAGAWATWLILAGRGFGKTRTGAEWIREQAESGRVSRIALVAEDAADARDVLVEGEAGILTVHPKATRPSYEPSKRRLTWRNGCQATLYSGADPDVLRGPSHHLAWCDELAKYPYGQAAWDNLQMGLRLGKRPRALVTTTPRPTPLIKSLLADPATVVTRGTTHENASNLPAAFLESILGKYAGTRLGRQELLAEILLDTPGALWRAEDIERTRISPDKVPPMRRIVVAVDPAIDITRSL